MKKITIIAPSILPIPAVYGGAIETLIQNFIDENEIQKKIQCNIITSYDRKAEIVSSKYSFSTFSWIKKTKKNLFFWTFSRGLNFLKRIFNSKEIGLSYESFIIRKILKRTDYDAVIVEGNGDQLHHLKNIISTEKLYFHIHSYHHCIPNDRNEYLMNIPTRIIAVSKFIGDSLNENLNIQLKSIKVVKNCIGKHFFSTKLSDTTPQVNNNEISIIFTGRIVREKGMLELLDALSLIQDTEWKLYIIGSFGSDFGLNKGDIGENFIDFEKEVKKRISKLGNRIVLMGYIENNKIVELYNQFDIAVVPSICNDAAPLIIGEFMAGGVPVVASNMGGIPEYLPKQAGILVANNESFVEKLAENITLLIENRSLRKQMSETAKQMAGDYLPNRYYCEIINSIEF